MDVHTEYQMLQRSNSIHAPLFSCGLIGTGFSRIIYKLTISMQSTRCVLRRKIYLLHNNSNRISRTISSRSLPLFASSKISKCPFQVLGVTRETPYSQIKKAFLKIALQNHPDTLHQHFNNTFQQQQQQGTTRIDHDYEKRKKECIQIFMNARQAFESIVPMEDGETCVLRTEIEQQQEQEEESKMKMSTEDFDAWFLHETGKNNPYQFDLDPATIREVADMTEKLGGDFGGGERDGGMWSLARMISQTVKSGTDGKDAVASVLRLEAGDINDKNHTQDYIGRDIGDGRFRRRRQSRFF